MGALLATTRAASQRLAVSALAQHTSAATFLIMYPVMARFLSARTALLPQVTCKRDEIERLHKELEVPEPFRRNPVQPPQ